MTTPRETLEEALAADDPAEQLEALVLSGWAGAHLPELPALRLPTRAGWHHKDVYRHTLQVVRQSRELGGDRLDLLAALLHDIAKPATRRFEEGGEVTFHGHDTQGARMARRRMETLGYLEDEVALVEKLVEEHLRAFGYHPGKWGDSAVRRLVTDLGEELPRLLRLFRSDITTGRPEQRRKLERNLDHLAEEVERIRRRDAEAALRPVLSGDEVMELLSIGPGREVGKILKYLLELRKQGVELTREEAEQVAWELHTEQ